MVEDIGECAQPFSYSRESAGPRGLSSCIVEREYDDNAQGPATALVYPHTMACSVDGIIPSRLRTCVVDNMLGPKIRFFMRAASTFVFGI